MSSYSTILLADTYFASKMYTQAWDTSDDATKQLALNEATQIIDRFAYIGWKTDDLQEHEWPRKGILLQGKVLDPTVIPVEILYAQYEIAIALLKGIDPEKEIRGLRVTSRGYSSVRTSYDTKFEPEYIKFGIPSAVAWQYLSIFFDRIYSGSVILKRIT